jgi:predicted transcriptional regulator
MRYLYLTELGFRYFGEEGSPGVRTVALTALEATLKQAMVDLNNAIKATPTRPLPVTPKGTGRVAQLVARHETFQKQAAPDQRVAELQAKVAKLRAWLRMQDCVLKPDGSIDWLFSHRTVEYDHDLAKQGMTKVRFRGGRLFLDDACTKPLDTEQMVTHFSGPGYAIYVMSKRGDIHVSSHSVGYRHHSSLLAGKKVAGAGELKAANGHLHWISNKSGHYRPSMGHLLQVLHQLQKNGVSMDFQVLALPDNKTYQTVGHLLKALEMADEPDYELMKLLRYAAHLRDEVLRNHQPNPWRWRSDPVNEKAGVYDAVTNKLVPHKEVRQWLKSQGLNADKEVNTGSTR